MSVTAIISSSNAGLFKAMVSVGQLVYTTCKSGESVCKTGGWVVFADQHSVVLATAPKLVRGFPLAVEGVEGNVKVAFLRVPGESVASQLPSGWKGPKEDNLPSLDACKKAWAKVDSQTVKSSDAEAATGSEKGKKDLQFDMEQLQQLLGREDGSSGSSSSDSESEMETTARAAHFLPPGRGPLPKERNKSKTKSAEVDVNQLMLQGLAAGQAPSELMPLMMMSMLASQQSSKNRKKKKSRRKDLDILGGSSSDSASEEASSSKDTGSLKAVASLHRLHKHVKKHPERVCKNFEKEMTHDLGVIPGQAWSVRDYLRKQQWGKFKGIYRCAMMDAEAYELARSGDAAGAAAQLCQNMKAKMQSVIQGGDWSSAWLLTGLPDPLAKKEFGGSREEMAVVSGYVEALHRLRKKVLESKGHGAAEDEEEEGAGRRK